MNGSAVLLRGAAPVGAIGSSPLAQLKVEQNAQDSRHRLWQPMPEFPDLVALNAWLERRCQELWHEIPHGALPGSVADVWTEEPTTLMQLPPAFDGFVAHSKRVSPTCLISFERNRWSVSASFANRPVSLRVCPDRLVIAAEGQTLYDHERLIQRSHKQLARTIYDSRHYPAVLQRKPSALRNGAPFVELPASFKQLQDQMLRPPLSRFARKPLPGNGRRPRA